ncbi:shikimate dehydrogenase [Helicobacter monodelphidis]|uniref:shikimate dehydrogenase n=1 Tax=Helicobacter sp. 15-1451 TaxID=2004995 RepID=UPI000DCB804B|nr:shikimate dehydrogenase [Helicobacter sp. 15-1451]RAX58883.1 shikimate dehydrogenase [Helicobacter sp. 15-1451]
MNYFAVFGRPIAHSQSPLIYNTLFARLGLSGRYSSYLLEENASVVEVFLRLGLTGANVTLPFKESVLSECDEVRGVAKEIGSVNTIVKEGDKIIGYNSDAEGFYRTLNKRISPKNALLIGAGGSAKAIAFILAQHNIPLTIVNRSVSKLERFKTQGFSVCLSDDFNPVEKYDLVINATSAGLQDDNLPLSSEQIAAIFKNMQGSQDVLVYEIIYGRTTPFLALAKNLQIPSVEGFEMLMMQAALSATHFLKAMNVYKDIGSVPDKDKCFEIISSALE